MDFKAFDFDEPVTYDAILQRISDLPKNPREMLGIAGPPGSEKSTRLDSIVSRIDSELGEDFARIVQMDGFHYLNQILRSKGINFRKGAAITFDVDSFVTNLESLGSTPGHSIQMATYDRKSTMLCRERFP